MSASNDNPWLHRFTLLTAAATLALLGVGGLVTSHDAGMAVPDWPNSCGYNMFFFPVSKWFGAKAGGVFYEHSHRLAASGVGLLTGILALWLYGKNARPFMRWTGLILFLPGLAAAVTAPKHQADGIVCAATGLLLFAASFAWPRCPPAAKWLRRLGLVAFGVVVLQGVLGGLRVVLFRDQIGIVHATLAQSFFALTCALALFTSRGWRESAAGSAAVFRAGSATSQWLRRIVLGTTLLIFGQLILGATMRHQHAGLAIRDFPLAYGELWPAMDADAVARYNQQRLEVTEANPITAFQIGLQMAHRLMALVILIGVGTAAWLARKQFAAASPLRRLASVWLVLVLAQIGLGAATIWTNKAADVATAHVLLGALSLVTGALWCLIAFRRSIPVPGTGTAAASLGAVRAGAFALNPRAPAGE